MAGDWIKIEHATADKPEIHCMADRLNIEPEHVLGCLIRLWVWADQQTFEGNAASVTKITLDRISRVTGFADAMESAGWLRSESGFVVFPNFDRHNGQTAKQRGLTAKRVARHKDKIGNAKVTLGALPREEKRREEYRSEYTPINSVCPETPQAASSGPPASAGVPAEKAAVLEFPCDGTPSAWCLSESQLSEWQRLFPALDVLGECRAALAWVLAVPDRRKTARGMLRFLVGWLGRSQNNGRGGANGRSSGVRGDVRRAKRIVDPDDWQATS